MEIGSTLTPFTEGYRDCVYSLDKTKKIGCDTPWQRPSRNRKTNLTSIICTRSSTNPANLTKIGPVNVGTTDLKGIVKIRNCNGACFTQYCLGDRQGCDRLVGRAKIVRQQVSLHRRVLALIEKPGFPGLFTGTSDHVHFLLFGFLFFTCLVFGSVR